jgi:hypothetical protein
MIIKYLQYIINKINYFLNNLKHSYKLEIKYLINLKLILILLIKIKNLINLLSINNFLMENKL